MMTVFVTTVIVLVVSFSALTAIAPLMLQSMLRDDAPDNVVHIDQMRRRTNGGGRPAA